MPSSLEPRLVIGLGNPGEQYALTYHNAGLLAVAFLRDFAIEQRGEAARAEHRPTFDADRVGNLIFVTPKTFMNESGIAARDALRFFRIPPENMIVLHDESDLALGTYKIVANRGAAGHHGIESIIAMIGTSQFTRARIGIRDMHPEHGVRLKAGDFVLKPITPPHLELLRRGFQELATKLIEKI